MNKTGFALENVVAENLYHSIKKALPNARAKEKAEMAQIIINTLARLSVADIARFHNAMVDYMTLESKGKEEVISRLCVKITEY